MTLGATTTRSSEIAIGRDRPPLPPLLRLKRILLGRPLHTHQLEQERLNNPTALAVFASDNLSSVAYASEEILHVLLGTVGIAAFSLLLPVTYAILFVLGLLILSYRQTIKAYPSAGGAYIVTKDNLGLIPAQVAGVALLTDYVLTVAVSASAGVLAIYSAVPGLRPYKVPITIAFILVIAYINLRGVKESGRVFAVPTYGFILGMAALLGVGFFKYFTGHLHRAAVMCAAGLRATVIENAKIPCVPQLANKPSGFFLGAGLFLVLRAFANGGSAVTGVEAISNGVPAFKKPEWQNARKTLVVMGATLGTMFLGLSFLATQTHPAFNRNDSVISQIGKVVFGSARNPMYGYLQVMTAAILILAANTSFADFPRLASFHAEDDFMPRPFTRRGHRLVFSNGILTLAGWAVAVVLVFHANVDKMIPLYALGVFISFTMSQTGMTIKHWRDRAPGWRSGLVINGLGAVMTAIVDVVIAITKFHEGAWMVMIAVPVGVVLLVHLNRTYERERGDLQLTMDDLTAPAKPRHDIVILVERLDAGTAHALRYAKQISPFGLHSQVTALHLAVDSEDADTLMLEWADRHLPVPLAVVACSDRNVPACAVDWLRARRQPATELTVIVPQRGYTRPWHRLVHDRTSQSLAKSIRRYAGAQVILVPHHLAGGDLRIPAPGAKH